MVRFGVTFGANKETFYGLAGLGDLVLTCTGALSRNYQVGLKLGQGKRISEVFEEVKQVAEGVKTALVIKELAGSQGLELPICEEVYNILSRGKTIKFS